MTIKQGLPKKNWPRKNIRLGRKRRNGTRTVTMSFHSTAPPGTK